MLPFPILGFIMKPLQLKGDHILLFDVFLNSLKFLTLVVIMHYLTSNVGFAPSESKQTQTFIERNVSETGGISESFVYYFSNLLSIFSYDLFEIYWEKYHVSILFS